MSVSQRPEVRAALASVGARRQDLDVLLQQSGTPDWAGRMDRAQEAYHAARSEHDSLVRQAEAGELEAGQ